MSYERCEDCGLYRYGDGSCACGAEPNHGPCPDCGTFHVNGSGVCSAEGEAPGIQPGGTARTGPGMTDVHPINTPLAGLPDAPDEHAEFLKHSKELERAAERSRDRFRKFAKKVAKAAPRMEPSPLDAPEKDADNDGSEERPREPLRIDDGGGTYLRPATDNISATLTVGGRTLEIEVSSFEVSFEDGACHAEIVGEVVDEAEPDGTESASDTDESVAAEAESLLESMERNEVAARADESSSGSDGPDPPDDDRCEACERLEWSIRMWDSELDMHFHYCEDCAGEKELEFDSLSRDGAR